MPRFYIDSNDDDFHLRDEEGQEFPNLAAARDAAMMMLPDMAREKLPDGDQRVFCVNVRDERGATRYTATLSLVGEWKQTE
ncbi:DUF6894 family protein [Methylobacterium oxalidis]|uniref:DUF6894 domain-containing protein n=1 Tax=Methylobacterium oxalidis TaxID=944322 RepID=A0ABQ6DGE4_9HYPH|nr:hypothetical protein [Methylobacterium oxalidis]GJE30693.1 hypothetical protein LDDCCGHA_0862 [Methylobacterium oxalidis]GLS63929.1 hypothetical protein GCM10007888_23100 [Methylobacterium oxalidis]